MICLLTEKINTSFKPADRRKHLVKILNGCVLTSTLWSYHNGNLGFISYSCVMVTFSSCSTSSFNHR